MKACMLVTRKIPLMGMSPRFGFRVSKFRNLECTVAARDASYDQLQVTSAMVDGNAMAATADRFAFPNQLDGGAAIQVQPLSDTGKQASQRTSLLRGHAAHVNALAFAPFTANVLLSGSADATVKVWVLGADATSLESRQSATATLSDATAPICAIKPHPAAADIVSVLSHHEALVYDLSTANSIFQRAAGDGDAWSGLAWNYDGSVALATSLDQKVYLLDPRVSKAGDAVQVITVAHAGHRRPTNVVWCGRQAHFVTTGSDGVQERELKLWDPRNLSAPVHRERLDSSIGQLFPLYDVDVNLLYLTGKGDRSVRCFEVDTAAPKPFVHHLSTSMLPHMTLAAALLPKQACDTNACEVARLLTLSGSAGICSAVAFSVPRKNALTKFQGDLYPDTTAMTPALSAEQWWRGENIDPKLEPVQPTPKQLAVNGLDGVFGGGGTAGGAKAPLVSWNAPQPAAAAAAPSPAPAWGATNAWTGVPPVASATALSTNGGGSASATSWGSKATAWNAPSTSISVPQPAHWSPLPAPVAMPALSMSTDADSGPVLPAENAVGTNIERTVNFTERERNGGDRDLTGNLRRLSAAHGHKLKYIKGTRGTGNEAFHLGEKATAFAGGASSSVIKTSTAYWALPLVGAGGPVLVSSLDTTGRAPSDDLVLNGHKTTVTDLDFNALHSEILATGAGDAVISIWKLNGASSANTPVHQLRGHTKGIRTVVFHPFASGVLCSTSQDLTLRLWDVEAGVERICIDGKLEDAVWNAAFSPDGSLVATSSRAKIVRVFDPRDHNHSLVAIGCGFDSPRPQFVSWLSNERLITIGTNARHETQLRIWDARSLVDPLVATTLDIASDSSNVPLPFYDESSRALFLVGVGGRHVWSYEIDSLTTFGDTSTTEPAAFVRANLPFVADGSDPISGAGMLPKTLCDVRTVEIDRMLLLRGKTVEKISFSLPRTEKLKKFFQDDVYGPVRSRQSVQKASQWFAGESIVVEYESLRPLDMVPLSEKPVEVNRSTPNSQHYREKWEQEERDKLLKIERLERLQTLAAQPSLHAVNQAPERWTGATQLDRDDDWED